ncbi:MAG: VOC family protein [Pseudomonadota bacterium]|nr:VOC family protein [Pseudomonadota bacterium]
MEVDHLFICVQPGASEAEALKAFGLTEGTHNRHPGQGTANRRFFFHNAMLELLWLDGSGEAMNERTKPTRLWERCARRGQHVSPFGICFRPKNPVTENAPFPVWRYRPTYLPDALSIEIGDGSPLSEPMWFFLSFGQRPDAYPQDRRQPLSHKVGLREITAVRLSPLSPEDLSLPALAVVRKGCVSPGQVSSFL